MSSFDFRGYASCPLHTNLLPPYLYVFDLRLRATHARAARTLLTSARSIGLLASMPFGFVIVRVLLSSITETPELRV